MPFDRIATRRSFLKFGAAAAALSPIASLANPLRITPPDPRKIKVERHLKFENLHTGEKLKTVYWQNGRYLQDSLKSINHILRDYRTDQIKTIDEDLLDLLNTLSSRLETDQPFEIISGYRSPETNAMLRSRSKGVASNSYHMRGQAMDLRVPGKSLKHVHNAALDMQMGGVGYYPSSDFVHVDTGPLRTW